MNPIGVHFIPTHTGAHHYQFIRDMRPGILKLVSSSTPDVQLIVDGHAAAPNALMYLRNVARSEQHDFLWREPERAAQQHVQEWHADIQQRYHEAQQRGLVMPDIDQIRILGVNEPVVELFPRKEDMSNYNQWLAMMNERTPKLDSYMVTFGYEANRLGYGSGLGNISSGQPANKKPGEYATFDWFPKTRKLLESTRGLNAYACHEYWRAETGPEGHADWHAWRFTHLNVDCDIDILESGVDQKITDEDPHGNRGWVGHMIAPAYVDQHGRYIARALQDSRFRCETPFTLDGDKIWESFWIEYCMADMVSLSSELQGAPSTPDTPPFTIHLPAVGTGPQEPPKTAYVSVPSGANLRKAPSMDGEIITAVPYGGQIYVYPDNTGTSWRMVVYQGQSGYMNSSLFTFAPPTPAPAPEQPATGDKWQRTIDFVMKHEGGFQDADWDVGNWTKCEVGKGEKKGTNFGISACSYPNLDIRNLTREQAIAIYERDYWQKSGAAALPWPACLIVMDTAVLHGVGTAQGWLAEVGTSPYAIAAKRLRSYTKLQQWPQAGAGWANRVADLLEEANK